MAKEAAQPQDQSMEEILQSIKRIIAEENVETPAEPAPKQETDKKAEPAKSAPKSADVLELTDVAEDDDESGGGDAMEALQAMIAPPAPAPQPAPSSVRPESILEAVEREPARDLHKDVLMDIDSLLSSEAAKASAKALKSIPSAPASAAPAPKAANPGMGFRSGTTVEDLAMEALRPMLKDWLDTNLPSIVERLVEREIKKISAL